MKELVKNKNTKYKKISSGLICLLIIILGFLCFQGYVYYKISLENNRLLLLKEEYLGLCKEIEDYKLLKGQYELVLNNNTDLQENKKILEKKVNDLNIEIENLELKIKDVNNKIKNLS